MFIVKYINMYNGAHVQSIAEYFYNKKNSTSTDYSRSHTLALFLELIVHPRGSTFDTIAKNIYVQHCLYRRDSSTDI